MTAPAFLLCSQDEYFADPCDTPSLDPSTAHVLISKSPRHAWLQHPKLGNTNRIPTKDMDKGSLIHTILLGEGKDIIIVNADDWRSKDARNTRDEIRKSGGLPVLQKDIDAASEACEEIKKNITALGYTLDGESEQMIAWEEQTTDGDTVQCRGMMDHLKLNQATIIDLKKTLSAHPKACGISAVTYGMDIQCVAYMRGVGKIYPELADRLKFIFLFCEFDAPYSVTPAVPSGTMRELGRRKWQRAIDTWHYCNANNDWPMYAMNEISLDVPMWALNEEAAYGDLEIEL